MKVFLVCSVRNASKKEKRLQEEYVQKLEARGEKMHWPHRDTKQNDPTGLNIITQNRQAILDADEIHFWWKADKTGKSKSEGSVFDFGMTWMALLFMPNKKIVLANPDMVKPSENKSFTNVLLLLDSVYAVKEVKNE